MRIFNKSLILCMCVITMACSDKKRQSANQNLPIHIDISRYESKDLFLSDFVEDISYIRLETNPDYLVNSYAKVYKCPDGFLIRTSDTELGIFSEDGAFLNKVGKLGKGPGEYTFINYPAISYSTGKIFAQKDGSTTYYRFSKEGVFEKSVNYPKFVQPQEIVSVYDGMLIDGWSYIKKDSFVPYFIIDQDFNLIYEHEIPIPKSIEKASNTPSLYHSDYLDKVYIFDMHRDTVYFLDRDFKPRPFVILNRGSVQLKYEDRFVPNRIEFRADRFLYEFYVRGNIFLLIANDKPESYAAFYDLELKKLFKIGNHGMDKEDHLLSIENDIDGGPRFPFRHSTHDGYGYAVIQAFDLIQWKMSGFLNEAYPKSKAKKKELLKIIETLDPEDNPVIMKVKFKKGLF